MIKVRNLTKKYGTFTAVDNISFDIKRGHIYGFLGPNGAGKSTTMNMITGCLSPTEGTVEINGCDILDEPLNAKRAVGYLPEQPPLYGDMTVGEYLDFVAEAKGVSVDESNAQVAEAMEKTGTADVADRLIRNLSKGYKQRVGIAQAIIGDPEIVILDEPTVGLDPIQIREIRELIRELGKEHTVILSSHILGEISAVCDRVIVIAKGRIVASNSIDRLGESFGKSNMIKIESRGDAKRIESALSSIRRVTSLNVRRGAGSVYTEIETPANVDIREEVFAKFAQMNAAILSMTTNQLTLEDIFVKLTLGEDIGEVAEAFDDADEIVREADVLPEDNDDEGGEYTPMFTMNGDDDE